MKSYMDSLIDPTCVPVRVTINKLNFFHNINRVSGIEIPEAWIPTIRKHNSRLTTKRTCEGTTSNSRNNNEDRNAPIAANQHATNSET